MEAMPDTVTTPQDAHGDERGRVAVHELADLLLLRQRPLVTGVAAVVGLGLLLTLAAPSVVPSSALAGALVGLLALAVGATAAIVVDGADPVLRGPRHLRRDGHAVLPRLASANVELHGGPLVAQVTRRVEGAGRARMVVAALGDVDVRGFTAALGRRAAAGGLTSLVVDLQDRSAGAGIAEVGAGEARLGATATLAGDRPFAAIGAGGDMDAAIAAAAALAQRPPSDLQLLLVVPPATLVGLEHLYDAVDRVLLVVPADRVRREEVTARVTSLQRAGATVECVVVGGPTASETPAISAFGPISDAVADRTVPASGHVRVTQPPTPTTDTASPLAASAPEAAGAAAAVAAGAAAAAAAAAEAAAAAAAAAPAVPSAPQLEELPSRRALAAGLDPTAPSDAPASDAVSDVAPAVTVGSAWRDASEAPEAPWPTTPPAVEVEVEPADADPVAADPSSHPIEPEATAVRDVAAPAGGMQVVDVGSSVVDVTDLAMDAADEADADVTADGESEAPDVPALPPAAAVPSPTPAPARAPAPSATSEATSDHEALVAAAALEALAQRAALEDDVDQG